ncbi:hypothetical protein ACOME3_007112 [Neoechinorhynchus agilis]
MEVLLNALEKTTSSDPAELRFIDGFLRQASSNNYPEFVLHLSSVLCNSEASDVARFQAAIQIKNSIRSTDPSTRRSNLDRWRALPDALKQQVRRNCLAALGTERRRPSQAAQCIGAIACCDFPIKAWPDLIPQLSTNILKVDTSEALRISSLESIGYVCQDLDDSAINPEDSNKVLTAIVHGMRAGETSDDVKLAAANAMLNSLEFCQRNFEVDRERHYIMQVICECQNPEFLGFFGRIFCSTHPLVWLFFHYFSPPIFRLSDNCDIFPWVCHCLQVLNPYFGFIFFQMSFFVADDCRLQESR